MSDANPRRVLTPAFKISFPQVLTPQKNDQGKEKYSITMLFPPGTDFTPFKKALAAARDEKWPDPNKRPKKMRGPDEIIRECPEYNLEREARGKAPLEGYDKGWHFIRASSDNPPGIVGPTKGSDGRFPAITDAREVYPGRWARAAIDAYAFDTAGNLGVTFGLLNVQLLKHDAPLGGAAPRPEQTFDDAPDDMLDEEWEGHEDGLSEEPEPADTEAGW